MAITSAHQLELLQTAEAVAREKMIEPELVIEAMEDSLARAAKSRYGAEMDIRVSIDRKTGMRAYEGDSAIIEAFKPGTGPSDVYSVIGGDGMAWGVPTVVNPEADKAAVSGTGGLY